VQFLYEALQYKPLDVADHTVNNMHYRGLEGFIAAIAPFNFTAIGGNLCTAPALMGNVVLWKPSDTAVLSSYIFYKILRACGLPPGIINFVPADGPEFGEAITKSPDLAGINFTGSVPTFRWLWKSVGKNLETYKTFPRLSGECGGKNFHLIHESADVMSASVATVRSAFEYAGQKCSACSRLYVPESMWPQMRDKIGSLISELKIGTPLEFDTFTSAVIDEKSFDRIVNYIEYGKKNMQLLFGGSYDKSKGYYVHPTVFQSNNPNEKLFKEEIFGPVLSVYVYKNADYEKVLNLVDSTTPYALTGSIFAQDENVLKSTMKRLRQSCGNLYINDKSTGAGKNIFLKIEKCIQTLLFLFL
jgi:1-pyrroline-5-carboxylate dehydrogenase